mmetsp:Transcript_83965/g.175634  ORF Transcript_83965/g.175634 Transcript_83965/m.175634 type:complete len:271 (+) Transcript_83965:2705-3517(+)
MTKKLCDSRNQLQQLHLQQQRTQQDQPKLRTRHGQKESHSDQHPPHCAPARQQGGHSCQQRSFHRPVACSLLTRPAAAQRRSELWRALAEAAETVQSQSRQWTTKRWHFPVLVAVELEEVELVVVLLAAAAAVALVAGVAAASASAYAFASGFAASENIAADVRAVAPEVAAAPVVVVAAVVGAAFAATAIAAVNSGFVLLALQMAATQALTSHRWRHCQVLSGGSTLLSSQMGSLVGLALFPREEEQPPSRRIGKETSKSEELPGEARL